MVRVNFRTLARLTPSTARTAQPAMDAQARSPAQCFVTPGTIRQLAMISASCAEQGTTAPRLTQRLRSLTPFTTPSQAHLLPLRCHQATRSLQFHLNPSSVAEELTGTRLMPHALSVTLENSAPRIATA